MPRKRRTRAHIIADLSTNYVERFMLNAGFSVDRVDSDYGYDLLVFTHNASGEIENGFVLIQLKASDNPTYLGSEASLSFPSDTSDLETWNEELYPVILVIYDARREEAYWIYVQRHLASHSISISGTTVNVRVPLSQKVDDSTPAILAGYKKRIYDQLRAEVDHA